MPFEFEYNLNYDSIFVKKKQKISFSANLTALLCADA